MPKSVTPSVEITQGEKEKFFKCVVSDSPYTDIIELFDGQMTVEFRSMTIQENNDVIAQIVADKAAGTAADTDAYFITIAAYRLSQCLVNIDGKPVKLPSKDTFLTGVGSTDTYVAFRAKALKNWSTFKLAAFLDAFRLFEAKVLKLTGEVQSKDFWKASV